MSDINIYDDSRNRGTEVLLFRQEKNLQKTEDNIKRFELSFKVPFIQKRFNFRFKFFVDNPSNSSE